MSAAQRRFLTSGAIQWYVPACPVIFSDTDVALNRDSPKSVTCDRVIPPTDQNNGSIKTIINFTTIIIIINR